MKVLFLCPIIHYKAQRNKFSLHFDRFWTHISRPRQSSANGVQAQLEEPSKCSVCTGISHFNGSESGISTSIFLQFFIEINTCRFSLSQFQRRLVNNLGNHRILHCKLLTIVLYPGDDIRRTIHLYRSSVFLRNCSGSLTMI
jgi:hypothetical protein